MDILKIKLKKFAKFINLDFLISLHELIHSATFKTILQIWAEMTLQVSFIQFSVLGI